jgi:hypothetical protein
MGQVVRLAQQELDSQQEQQRLELVVGQLVVVLMMMERFYLKMTWL